MKERSDLDVSSHAFDQKEFWNKIKKDEEAEIVKFSGKKKEFLKPAWERAIDIIYKCLESKVVSVDDITSKKDHCPQCNDKQLWM